MIGWTLAAVLYLGFTAVLTFGVNTIRECWWKSLGIVLLVEAGATLFYILVALMFVALQRGI